MLSSKMVEGSRTFASCQGMVDMSGSGRVELSARAQLTLVLAVVLLIGTAINNPMIAGHVVWGLIVNPRQLLTRRRYDQMKVARPNRSDTVKTTRKCPVNEQNCGLLPKPSGVITSRC